MHLIFDFDGTLVDSFNKVIEKFNVLADEFNFRKINQTELAGLRNLSSKELIQYLKIPIYKIPNVLYRARKEMSNEMPSLVSFANLPQVLQKIYDARFSIGVLTSNSEENVIAWLEINKMMNLFDFIHVESNFFGKARVIRKILKKYRMNKQHVFYIGDETRDIDAAKQNGVYSIAVTWGFNSEKILTQHRPDYIAKNPEDLLTIREMLGRS
jgi:phosphoglycolate phosphatase